MTTSAYSGATSSADPRAHLFVGREDELRRLERLLGDDGPRIALVSGPGGVGKTELLAAFERRAKEAGVAVSRLESSLANGSELALAEALGRAIDAARGTRRSVLLIDGYEALAPFDGWIRETLAPSLPPTMRLVLAGRDAMTGWRQSHWGASSELMALGPLAPAEAIDYLARRGVPQYRHADIAQAAKGHPLALVLFAEVVSRDPTSATALAEHPALVQALLERFVSITPDATQREALWCCAVVLHLTEELLRDMTRSDSAHASFDWLRRLPFVATTPRGLTLHDLVRELLDADLAWRFPALRQRLIARAARHYRARAELVTTTSLSMNFDVAYLWRDAIPYTHGLDAGHVASGMRPSDQAAIRQMVESLQGREAWEWFGRWREHGAEVLVVRGPSGAPQAVALYLWLDRLDPGLAQKDPGCASVMRCLGASGELDGIVYRRFHIDRDAHQALAPSTLVITAHEFEMHVRRPEMRNALRAWLDPEVGLRELPPGMLARLPEADFDQGGMRFHVLRTTAHGRYFAWCLDRVFLPLLAAEDSPAPASKVDDPLSLLSRRQREVAELVSLGLSNKEIASALGTSAHTVRNQLVATFERLGVASRSELAALVARASPPTPPNRHQG